MTDEQKKKQVNVEDMQAFARVLHNKGIGNEAVCTTAAATAAKTVTPGTTFSLATGATIIVKFTNGISVSGATLQVGETAAKAIYYRGGILSADLVKAGDKIILRYDGSHYEVIGQLTPLSLPASDVAAWAKANGKPTYAFNEIEGQVGIPQLNTFITGVLTPDYYTKDQVNTLLSGIEQFEVLRVDTLPTVGAATVNKIYIAPTGTGGANEMWITAKEEQSSTIVYTWVKLELMDTYTKAEIDAMIGTATATPVVVQTNTAVSIEPNKLNIWQSPVASLSVSFQQGTAGVVNEYMIQFTCPSNAGTELSLPSGVAWANGQDLEPEAGFTYQVSVIDGLAVYAGWEA